MYKIGEFSKLVRISPRMLRHYEKCGLIVPVEIDRFTGYRRYSALQIPLLTNIANLRDVGFSIDEIGDILPHLGDAAYMDAVLAGKLAQIEEAIDVQRHKLKRIEAMRKNGRMEDFAMQYEVVLKGLPGVRVLSLREVIGSYGDEGVLWGKLGGFMAAQGIGCPTAEESGYSIYHDEDYKEADVDVEIAVPVAAFGEDAGAFVYKELEEVPVAATLRFAGPYEGYSETTSRLAAWIETNGYEIAGLMRGAAIRTGADQSDPNNFHTEIQIPVKKAAG